MPFTREITPRFNQLDPAGILFFGEIFTLCSGVYEDFLRSLGFEWEEWFRSSSLASPIRHAEADYLKPLEGGQVYEVDVEILTLGTSSFEVGYTVQKHGVPHCRVRIVHVFMDVATRTKTAIPAEIREVFTQFGVAAGPADPS